MSTLLKNATYRGVNFGAKVERATAVVPQTASGAIFTVSNGRAIVTGLMGLVTVAGSATVTNLKVRSLPTVGSAVDIAANGLVTSAPIGTIISITGTPADAISISGGSGQILDSRGVIIPAGAIQITTDAANASLSIAWTLLYIGLDDGTVVTAA